MEGDKLKGVMQARPSNVNVPLVARLASPNVDEGRKILIENGLQLVTAETFAQAGKSRRGVPGRLAA